MTVAPALPRLPFVDLAAQRAGLGSALEDACLRALRHGDYILGEDVDAFEAEFARYCGVGHAVGVDSGTSALELVLRAHDIGPGDEVITAVNTFVATAFAICHCGARPVFVDCEQPGLNLDVSQLEAAITVRTRAIVPVHLYGQPADMSAVRAIADAHGLGVIEDACQAHGARLHGRRAGSLGDAAAFSFYPAKNLGGHGDGGMIVTDDGDVAERVRLLRNYGTAQKYRSETIGYNRRLDTLQAAMLRVKLTRLDSWNAARRDHAARYDTALGDLALVRPQAGRGTEPVWHLYVIRVRDRDGVRAALDAAGIETGIHYPVPLHLQPALRQLGYGPGAFPVAEATSGQILSLPMYPDLDPEAPQRVAAALAGYLRGSGLAERGAP